MTETFRPADRIRRRADFQRVYKEGVRVHGRLMTLFFLPTGQPTSRLGIAATRKFGGAVQRNLAKRRVREAFRRNKGAAGYDIVVIPKREMLTAAFVDLEADYCSTLKRRARR
jgi:ribonuclease P protein component